MVRFLTRLVAVRGAMYGSFLLSDSKLHSVSNDANSVGRQPLRNNSSSTGRTDRPDTAQRARRDESTGVSSGHDDKRGEDEEKEEAEKKGDEDEEEEEDEDDDKRND